MTNDLARDFRIAVRICRQAPLASAATILLLALGIGGVLTLFGPLHALVLTPVALPSPDQLVQIHSTAQMVEPYTNALLNQRALESVFSNVTVLKTGTKSLTSEGRAATDIAVASVSPSFFATLATGPRLGRVLDASGVIVSDAFWRTRLHKRADLGNCWISLEGNRRAVLGVMPPDFAIPAGVQVWEQAGPGVLASDPVVIGRMHPGLSIAQAQAGLRALTAEGRRHPDAFALESLHDAMLGDRRPLLWILFTVTVLFLAMACAGASNLILVRSVRRRREMAMRFVLGASRGRLVRQFLTETLVIAASGGLLGIALSLAGSRSLAALFPSIAESAPLFSIPSAALLVALVLAVTVFCGIVPALYATSSEPLKVPGGRRFISPHELFASCELMLAMTLLICTGLLLRSLVARLQFPLGFEPNNVVVIRIPAMHADSSVEQRYEQEHGLVHWKSQVSVESFMKAVGPAHEAAAVRNALFYADASRRLAELSGVDSLEVVNTPPFTAGVLDSPWQRVLFQPGGDLALRGVLFRNVSPGAFRLMRIPVRAGRSFTPNDIPSHDAWKYTYYNYRGWSDVPEPEGVAIVNETLARRLWPNQNPLGRMIYEPAPLRVIGVVADIHESRQVLKILPTVYRPFTASSALVMDHAFLVKLRPGASARAFSVAAAGALQPMVPGAPALQIQPLDESLGNLPVAVILLSCFAVLGALVAGLGVYATATVVTSARTQELGIRRALGASPAQICRLMLWRSARLAGLALPAGALSAWVLGAGLSHWLFQVSSTDWISYLGGASILLVLTIAAGGVPALRAVRIAPSHALRHGG